MVARSAMEGSGRERLRSGGLVAVTVLVACAVTASASVSPAAAQYFGRNKVQYDDFDFNVLRTGHFDIYFYGGEAPPSVLDAGRMAERWYERFARTFQYEFRERKPLILYADKPDFQQTNAVPGFISQTTGGVTEGMKNRVVLPMAETYGETDHVVGHEFVHLFQYDLAQGPRGSGATALTRVPLWMVEGLAEYLSLGRDDPHTAMWMRDAVLRDDLPTLDDLTRRSDRYFPYRYGHAFWAYVGGRWNDETVVALFRSSLRTGPGVAIREVLGVSPDTLSQEWIRATREHYAPLLEGRTPAGEVGARILAPETGAGETNLSPVVSPDGQLVAFFSQRDVFTFDLYLADARTGEVLGTLASAERDPHFDALSLTGSAGAWSPDGGRFAFVSVAEGDNQIAVVDAGSRRVERGFRADPAAAVFSLAWSPDGRRIAFSGSREGITDLFVLDVATGEVRQLTHDRFAELHPDWSPDGRTLVFATDRTDDEGLERLSFPEMGIGMLRVDEWGGTGDGGDIEIVRPFGEARHTNPRYAPDGQSLYFIGDPDGFSDIYRMDLRTRNVRRVTRLASGVSGLTPLAPSLSVARESGQVVFTVYEGGDYIGYALESQETRGEPARVAPEERPAAGMLPPDGRRSPGRVDRYLKDATTGLRSSREFEVDAYRPRLQLDYLAQPTVGVFVDRFGTAVAGSIGAWFSDMLGDHELVALLQAGGDVQDVGGGLVYANRKRRLNWQTGAFRAPYVTSYASIGTGTIDGQPARVVDYVLSRTYLSQVFGVVEHPLSTTRRLEAQAGYLRYGYDREAIRYWLVGDRVVREERVDLDAPHSMNLAQGSLAYVEDFSFFGFTSPVRGGRSRLEVGGYTGTLEFFSLLADHRRYSFWNPVTLAHRWLHYGRYGPDGDSPRLSPLFLGYESLVRGYSAESFQGDECTEVPDDPRACPEWDRLLGSRIGVVNVELRLPILGTGSFGLIHFDYLPTELALFADAGAAWTSEESPELRFERVAPTRIPVFSTGVTIRMNLFGQLVLEIYYAHPFQRPARGGHFGFHLAPGW